jgi:hypothetical protein
MKFTLALAFVATTSAFTAPNAFMARRSTGLDANIMDTVRTLDGPQMVWGSEGVLLGHDENDVKGYDSFGLFFNAVEAAGLSDTLKGPGPFTVFAPVDSAFMAWKGPLTAEVLKYHVVSGTHSSSSISSDLPTLNGKSLLYGRRFRKTFVDDAIIGQADNFGGGSSYPTDVVCDNGVIHAISTVLDPVYAAVGGGVGQTQL